MIRRKDTVRSGLAVDVELDVEIVHFAERRIVFVPQSVIQNHLRSGPPFVLSVKNIVFLSALALPCCSIVEDARTRKISDIAEARQTVRKKIRNVVVGILRSTVAICVKPYGANLCSELHGVPA